LVGQDKLMRSDSYRDPKHHSVIASFKNPAKGKVAIEAFKRAMSGEKGADVIMDCSGNPVLSAYAPLQIGDTVWAMMAEIDQQEVVSESVAAKRLLNRILSQAS
jgi:methyl-accepting chemotaxis protein